MRKRLLETSAPISASPPKLVDRKRAAALVNERYFPISPRTLEAWPLTLRRVNGKALIDTAELFKLAEERIAAAPVTRGGRRFRQHEEARAA
ncbi:hypothetical protein J5Y09_04100 [Roseomonas sp. PWR1]|uniref:Uncharacterized protein n=1 Tax=Roseomonas nitratireducens TaxID=2820810 RepID=A0ABS4ANZ6_9PROT|nr:hypothetical protein [Neoroseomonas nitratireducens]MBP0463083.1 hypothetical protein [Neoroseomonas nitratireducens]